MGSGNPVMRPAVFLDRDGVINRAIVRDGRPYPPASLDELEILAGVREALADLRRAGYALVVVTNQPDVARGTTPRVLVESINEGLKKALPLDSIRACFHDSVDDCTCRKPRPGMLLDAAQEMALDIAHSYMVGDRWRDIEAGRRAGCRTIFVDNRYDEPRPENPDFVVASLLEATKIILNGGIR
jgi:D-glycero-D-manno-heptose 1,7-bisphosphate phosphatase